MARRQRRRLPAADARRAILDAAEQLLIAGGPDAVRVQAVARELGITDAAVHYHFGSRVGLMDALLRSAGRRLRQEVSAAVADWDADTLDMGRLVQLLSETYERKGYARLALWLSMAGWRPKGAGMFKDLAETIHGVRRDHARRAGTPDPELADTMHVLALMQILLCAEPILGRELRRSVGLPGDLRTGDRFREWVGDLLQTYLTGAAD